ncbi:23S rRNA (cytidine(2498)-2'-O)-methyltransferase RlmM [Halothiobacillus sp. DCM-1]|uniref:23S rRNA (cytidine(2498)-2'-O)-methyltransferase RlmM n=1 Tax=Halothiobacillus sp. DCM-1 TaxID=3112558 RepID=UPI00324C1C19
MNTHLLLLTRAGYEGDAAAQVQAITARAGVYGYCQTESGSGLVRFITPDTDALTAWFRHASLDDLIFARQWCLAGEPLTDLPADNRLSPILAALAGQRFAEVVVETPDAEATRPLLRLCRSFSNPLGQALRRLGMLQPRSLDLPVLHIVFADTATAYLGWTHPAQGAPWPMGIPRLRQAKEAPSRSALKLEEAIILFLSPAERSAWLCDGRTAVDLGAAPGGWTWQLLRDGLHVTAVDNGALAPAVAAHPNVEHRREDGFTFRPKTPVDWLVCDMVEQPGRVAVLMAEWLLRGDCQRALFNLKLPMKKRQQAVVECQQAIEVVLGAAARPYSLTIRQLYHDRDEVTAYLRWA